MPLISELALMKVKTEKKEKNYGKFIIEPLLPGYGVTLANSLRRVILSSIEGSAITTVKINDVTHEFSTVKGLKEDLVDLIMNFKSLRVKSLSDDEETLKLKVNGPKKIFAKDFSKNPEIEILESEHYIAEIEKGGKLNVEAKISKGTGYLPIELRQDEKQPLGFIMVDAIFTPIKKINYTIENTRVGQLTNYDKIIFEITTDGSIDPEMALANGANILRQHYSSIAEQAGYHEDKTNKPKNVKSKSKK